MNESQENAMYEALGEAVEQHPIPSGRGGRLNINVEEMKKELEAPDLEDPKLF